MADFVAPQGHFLPLPEESDKRRALKTKVLRIPFAPRLGSGGVLRRGARGEQICAALRRLAGGNVELTFCSERWRLGRKCRRKQFYRAFLDGIFLLF